MNTDKRPIIVYTPFNQPWGGRTFTPEWIAERVRLYLRYTVPSLARQTVAPWAIWLDCGPGSKEDLAPHLGGLTAAGVTATFDRGAALLAGLPADAACFYLLRLDSDDLYGPDAIECVAELQGTARCSQFYRGYVYDLAKQRLSNRASIAAIL